MKGNACGENWKRQLWIRKQSQKKKKEEARVKNRITLRCLLIGTHIQPLNESLVFSLLFFFFRIKTDTQPFTVTTDTTAPRKQKKKKAHSKRRAFTKPRPSC